MKYLHFHQDGGCDCLVRAEMPWPYLSEHFTLCCEIEAETYEQVCALYHEHIMIPRREMNMLGQGPPLEARPWFGHEKEGFYGEKHAG